jgi:hypothetical protein
MPKRLNARTARRYRARGISDPTAAILSQNATPASALPTTGQPLTAQLPDGGGRAGQVVRLEADVAHLRARLAEAALAGDLVAERVLRRQVTQAEDVLRKALESAPVELGGTGELVPKSTVITLLKASGWLHNAALRAALAGRTQLLAQANDTVQVAKLLADARETSVAGALVALAGTHVQGHPVPAWACEALAHHWAGSNIERVEWLEANRKGALEVMVKLMDDVWKETT